MTTRNLRPMARLSTISRAPPRTRAQLASEVTRLEFERDRALRDLALLETKRAAAERRFADIDARSKKLRSLFSDLEADEGKEKRR